MPSTLPNEDRSRKFWDERSEWSTKTFGTIEFRGPLGPIKHLKKEVDKELLEPLLSTEGLTREQLLEELVDCKFLVEDALFRSGYTYDEMMDQCDKKLEINKNREWPQVTSTEPVEHKKEEVHCIHYYENGECILLPNGQWVDIVQTGYYACSFDSCIFMHP